jgi:hypothetical protein
VSAFFLDSSALAKRYVSEPGSAWIQAITTPEAHHQIVIARIAWVEVLSALARRQREVSLPSAAAAAPLVFVSADDRLIVAAQAEGISTDNPKSYV